MFSSRLWVWIGFVLCGVLPTTPLAEGGWQARVGASYREFDDIAFSSRTFRDFGNTDATAAPLGLQGYTNGNTGGFTGLLSVDHARYDGGEADLDGSEKIGLALAAARGLGVWKGSQISAVLGAQLYSMERNAAVAANGLTTFNYNHVVVGGTFSDPQALVPPVLPTPGLQAGTLVSFENDFEMNLLVLDLGLEAAWAWDWLSLHVAAGPTLTLADTDTSQTQRASWGTFGLPGPGSYTSEEAENDTDVLVGGYVATGIGVSISERLGISAEVRYDLAGGDAGTSQATMDLDSASGQLKLVYSF